MALRFTPAHVLIALAIVVVPACDSAEADAPAASSGEPAPDTADAKARCDETGLKKMHGAMPSAEPSTMGRLTAVGLSLACEHGLPPTLVSFLASAKTRADVGLLLAADPERAELEAKACPNLAEVEATLESAPGDTHPMLRYRGCKLDRFAVLPPGETGEATVLFPWAVHVALTDQGVDSELVRDVTRGLLTLERELFVPLQVDDAQRLPFAPVADPVDASAFQLVIGPESIRFADETVLALGAQGEPDPSARKGHMLPGLYQAMVDARGAATADGEAPTTLIVVGDQATRFGTLVDVLFTSGRAEMREFAIAVDRGQWRVGVLPMNPPERVVDPPPAEVAPLDLRVFVMREGYRVSAGGAGAGPDPLQPTIPVTDPDLDLLEPARWDVAALEAKASEFKKAFPNETRVTISAETTMPLQALVLAAAALRGTSCDTQNVHTCLFPTTLVEASAATSGIELTDAGLVNTTGDTKRGVVAQTATVMGSLDKDIIRRIVRAHINEVRACYNKALAKDPKLAGLAGVSFVIGADGRVTSASAGESTIPDTAVVQCIVKAVKRWKFPKPRGGGIVKVTYPFMLNPG